MCCGDFWNVERDAFVGLLLVILKLVYKLPCHLSSWSAIYYFSHILSCLFLNMELQISIVSQEPVLFNCSVEENIAYGFDGKANITEIENAAVRFNVFYHVIFSSIYICIFTSSTVENCRKWPMHTNLYQSSLTNIKRMSENVGSGCQEVRNNELQLLEHYWWIQEFFYWTRQQVLWMLRVNTLFR